MCVARVVVVDMATSAHGHGDTLGVPKSRRSGSRCMQLCQAQPRRTSARRFAVERANSISVPSACSMADAAPTHGLTPWVRLASCVNGGKCRVATVRCVMTEGDASDVRGRSATVLSASATAPYDAARCSAHVSYVTVSTQPRMRAAQCAHRCAEIYA